MSEINKHIEQLLHEHDCVIVPDFGGFITSKKPAYYNPFTSVFFPATKKILFNKHLVFNDGLLAGKMAEKQKLSMAEAQQLLIQFKDDCFFKLDNEGRVEIERVGVLFFDKEKNIQFQQSSVNFLTDSFGLTPASLETIKKSEVLVKKDVTPVLVSRPVEVKEDRAPILAKKEREPRKRRALGAYVPLLIVPLLVGGLFMINQQSGISDQDLNLANLNPFYSAPVETYVPRDGKTFLVTKFDELNTEVQSEDIVELVEDKIEIKNIPVKVDSTFNAPVEVVSEKKYHVIAGCFSIKENAENLVQDWISKGNESKIVDKKGRLYRVAIQSFETRKEAKTFLRETKKSEGISLWVLKK
ncbi:MAG: SPOR domain-containing protein [Flavobacteriales bacterium]